MSLPSGVPTTRDDLPFLHTVQLNLYEGYATYGPTDIINGKVLFGFDLDHTIIRPQKGTFYKTTTDWVFGLGMDIRLRTLHSICKSAGAIVVFTNQGGVTAGKITMAEVIARIYAVMCKLDFPFVAFIGLSEQYRKPSPLMFEKLIYDYMPEFQRGYYIGDASGLDDDWSDSDYKFARNCGLKYVTVNNFQEVFNCPADETLEKTEQKLSKCAQNTPLQRPPVRMYFALEKDMMLNAENDIPTDEKSCIIILVGPPGCGKSSYAKIAKQKSGYTVISRDTAAHGKPATAAQCINVLKKSIAIHTRDKKPVKIIVDATHPDEKSREPFIKLAQSAGITVCAVVFCVAMDVAKYINKVRAISGGSYVPEIAYGMFSKRYSPPTLEEGFAKIIEVKQIPQNLSAIPDEYFDLYL